MNAYAEKILKTARSEIGTKEVPPKSNKQKYGKAYGINGVPWCMIFVWWCFDRCGAAAALPLKTASCGMMVQAARNAGCWIKKDFQPGDVLIYDFPKTGATTDHTGICESVNGDTVTAIEGNTSNGNDSNGGQVMRRTRKKSVVLGAVRPMWDKLPKARVEDTPAKKSPYIVAQEAVNGKWGNGDARKAKLEEAGYNPTQIQRLVNCLLSGGIKCQVTASDYLSIREKPDVGSKKLDIFGPGATVHVEEIKAGPGASAWGRVGNGWISLDYVRAM